MAVIKVTNSKAALSKAIEYITKKKKTEEKLVSGKDCNPSIALEQMQTTKDEFNKKEGRQYIHYVQSFAKTDTISHEKAHAIALEWAEKNFKGHEVLIATHKDKDHVHTHFIVNSVSFEDGKKFHSNKQDLEHLKVMSDEICEREGLSVIKEKNQNPDQFTSFNQGKYQMMKKLEQGKPVNSYLFNTAVAVDKSIETSKNRLDFINNMKEQGYETKWLNTNKHVTFKDQEGHKVRLSNLEKTFNNKNFSKEEIENGFSRIKENELAKHRESTATEGDKPRKPKEKQSTNQSNRNEPRGENRVREHTSKEGIDGIEASIREVERGVKGTPKQESATDNADIQRTNGTSKGTKIKQQNTDREHETRIADPELEHKPTIEATKRKIHSRDWDFER
ncbi:relaxase/mobilization nuclease domain-containing protein [Clostridium sp.]|jgi:hypothetical protein|uniref:relaxase/mobilization nuclease domain-containing protein n=1 Tax=Clostridium sp. TaxID=1506 RepID=UPI003FD74DD4